MESESISDPDWRPLISPRAKEKMDIVALFRNILPLIRHTAGHKICDMLVLSMLNLMRGGYKSSSVFNTKSKIIHISNKFNFIHNY